MIKERWISREEYEKDMKALERRLSSRGPMSPVSFFVYRTTNQSITVATTETLVQLNTETWDNYSAYDNATNYVFTAPAAGKYLFCMTARINNASGGNADIYARLRINGTAGTIFLSPYAELAVANGVTVARSGAAIYKLAVGDTVGMYAYTTAQPVTVLAGAQYSNTLSGCFLGT